MYSKRNSLFGFHLPEDFLIGTANSAFQSEGAWDRDGKSESIMDHYAKEFAGKWAPGYDPAAVPPEKRVPPFTTELPDRGCFFYDNYEAYIEDMAKTGQNTYRMSLAWPRIIPTGVGEVNPKGIEFYNKVIDCLLAHGITPFVDLYHWDMPQCLQDQGGFANPQFPEWFEAYAKVCFETFGDRVKMWSTFNETEVSISTGYAYNGFPPFHKDKKLALHAGHYCILAHYRAVRLYKSMNLGGKIGAVNCITALSPYDMDEKDLEATQRHTENFFGWWTEAMLEGTYPRQLIRECAHIRDNLPAHFQEDLDEWFVPMDFIGINFYISRRAKYNPDKPLKAEAIESFYSAPGHIYTPYAPGLFDVIWYITRRYHGVEIYITENGYCSFEQADEETECNDDVRVEYIREHLRMVARLIRVGCNLKGYYYWNDADSYEELSGYDLRFGLTWVDHATGRRRWKKSRYYFSKICKTKMVN